ncbi:hypothetical protein ABIQ69_11535 [Agromyces sp. G08B096]|uniref:DUF7426 domain-containing protein n=1 Tax=Agromyces sp. G08B096 TaxID=3156399 RepID=A0AAU7W5H3_9MICO
MTQLREYTEFSDGPLQFPIRGKVYTAPEIDIPTGMRLNGIVEGTADQDMNSVELGQLILGPVWDEMIADGVPLAAATRAVSVAMADFLYGREYAQAYWETGNDPKALEKRLAPNRASRRSTSTGGARKTR